MLTPEDERKLRQQLEELGVEEIKKRLATNVYGSHGSPKYRFLEHIIQEAEASGERRLSEKAIVLQQEANEISQVANEKADEANRISKTAKNISLASAIFSAIAIVVSIVAVIVGHYWK